MEGTFREKELRHGAPKDSGNRGTMVRAYDLDKEHKTYRMPVPRNDSVSGVLCACAGNPSLSAGLISKGSGRNPARTWVAIDRPFVLSFGPV